MLIIGEFETLGNNNRQRLLSKTWAATFTCEIETSMGQLTEGILVIKEVGNSEQASVYIVCSEVLPLEYVAQSRQHWHGMRFFELHLLLVFTP